MGLGLLAKGVYSAPLACDWYRYVSLQLSVQYVVVPLVGEVAGWRVAFRALKLTQGYLMGAGTA